MAIQRKAGARNATKAKSSPRPVPTEFNDMEELKKAFPKSFPKNGSVNLTGKKTLRRLPVEFRAAGTLTVNGCSRLETLPASKDTVYFVEAQECVGLREIDQRYAAFNGVLDLSGCVGLKSLPEGMKIMGSGSLILSDCTGLQSLPEGLEVDGKLVMTGCTGLTALPEHIKADIIDMRGCTNILELPATLSCIVINLRGCENIKIPQSLVDRITAYGAIEYPDTYEIIPDVPTVGYPAP